MKLLKLVHIIASNRCLFTRKTDEKHVSGGVKQNSLKTKPQRSSPLLKRTLRILCFKTSLKILYVWGEFWGIFIIFKSEQRCTNFTSNNSA